MLFRSNDAGYDWKILLWNLFPFFGQIAVLIFLCKETCVGLVEKCAREGHRWTYDRAKCLETCSVCAATRPKHNFRAVPDRCINKCTICGTETFRPHKNEPTDDPDFVRCKICGQYAVTLHRFTHEEKDALKFAIDIGVKANQNRSLDEVYASCERQVNSLSPAFGLVELTALAVTAHQVNQTLVQNVQKTQLNAGNINQNAVVNRCLTVAMNLKTAIDKMAVITEKFKNLTGNENAQAMGNASATKKPLAWLKTPRATTSSARLKRCWENRFPEPVISLAVEPATQGDKIKLSKGLVALASSKTLLFLPSRFTLGTRPSLQ